MGLEPLVVWESLPLAGRWLSVLEGTAAALVARLLSVFGAIVAIIKLLIEKQNNMDVS